MNKPTDHYRFLRDTLKTGYTGYLPWAWHGKAGWTCDTVIDPYFNRMLKELKLPGQPAP